MFLCAVHSFYFQQFVRGVEQRTYPQNELELSGIQSWHALFKHTPGFGQTYPRKIKNTSHASQSPLDIKTNRCLASTHPPPFNLGTAGLHDKSVYLCQSGSAVYLYNQYVLQNRFHSFTPQTTTGFCRIFCITQSVWKLDKRRKNKLSECGPSPYGKMC